MKRIPLLILSAIVTVAFAQYKDFDLATYKFPDWTIRSLTTSFSGNGLYNKEIDYEGMEIGKRSNSYWNCVLNYNETKNTIKYQRDITSRLSLDSHYSNDRYRYNSTSRQDTTIVNTVSPMVLYINVRNKRFINEKMFIETGIIFDTDIEYKYLNINQTVREDALYTELLTYLPVKFGRGRIERVDDARRAIYILEALQNADRICTEIGNEDIIDFANFIAQLRSERIFDSRLRYMKHLKDLDGYLQSKGYVDTPDATYFVTLDDFWGNTYQDERYSGKSVAMILRPGIHMYRRRRFTDIPSSVDMAQRILGDIGLEYINEKPLNLYWQEHFETVICAPINMLIMSYGDNQYLTDAQISLLHKFSYYPNSRTNIDLQYGVYLANLLQSLSELPAGLQDGNLAIQGMAGISLNYYVTPKLRINAGFSLNYVKNGDYWTDINLISQYFRNFAMRIYPNDSNEHEFYSDFNIRIDYSIF